ncbi:MAG: hypothetical protein GY756_28320 [bacterium]|nr:hypothetical protein [bacterium]
MKDYYKILGVKRKASQNRIFRRFRSQILELDINSDKVQDLIAGYLILQKKPRKLYNVLLLQYESKKVLSDKYVNALKGNENKAQHLSKKYENDRDFFLESLTKKPTVELLLSAIGPITGTDLSTPTSLGFGSLLIGTILIVIGLSRLNSAFLIISVFLMIIGIILCRKGITEWRRENFKRVTAHNK